jgi:ATP synthase I chain
MAAPSILRIERWNYGLGAVVVAAAAITQPRSIALGVTVGVLLTCANFFVLRKLVVKWTTDAAAGRSGNAPLLMLPKIIGLMGAVAVAILLLPINVVAFVIGYSIFMVSIVAETTYSALCTQPADPAPTGPSGPPNPTETSEHNG